VSVYEGSVESNNSDWGIGATDNTPSDVQVGSVKGTGYGSSESFLCTETGCS